MPESIKCQYNLRSLKCWPPEEDFNGNWPRSRMANLDLDSQNQCFLFNSHFSLIGFRESNFQVCMFKTSSKWHPKWLQNDVEFEVGNRSDWRMRARFPGFPGALSRLLRLQWEGKREGLQLRRIFKHAYVPYRDGGLSVAGALEASQLRHWPLRIIQ